MTAVTLNRLQALADTWSRRAAAIPRLGMIPGKTDVRASVNAATAITWDTAASELRTMLAAGEVPAADEHGWRTLTDAELDVIEMLMAGVKRAHESKEIAEIVMGWLRGVRDTGKVQVTVDHGHLPGQGAGR